MLLLGHCVLAWKIFWHWHPLYTRQSQPRLLLVCGSPNGGTNYQMSSEQGRPSLSSKNLLEDSSVLRAPPPLTHLTHFYCALLYLNSLHFVLLDRFSAWSLLRGLRSVLNINVNVNVKANYISCRYCDLMSFSFEHRSCLIKFLVKFLCRKPQYTACLHCMQLNCGCIQSDT